MQREPVVLVVHVDVDPRRPLPEVETEAEVIRAAFPPAAGRRAAEVRTLRNPTVPEVFAALRAEAPQRRIRVFHFAGHASGVAVMLNDGAGAPAKAHADGLADYLGRQPGLRLVVLNGCSTREQVARLRKNGVGAVVATKRTIHDDVAAEFAAQLYAELATKRLRAAFDAAVSVVETRRGRNPRELARPDPVIDQAWPTDSPWLLDCEPKLDGWRLPNVDEHRLVDELARIFYDPDMARTVIGRVGFPRRLMPHFSNGLVFWSQVVESLLNGVLEDEDDGVQKLIDEVAMLHPREPFFADHRTLLGG